VLAQVATARQRVKLKPAPSPPTPNAKPSAQASLRAKFIGFVSAAKEDSARSEAQARRAGCAAAKADVVQAEARVRLTRVEEGRTVLYAPFAGTIAKIVGEVGEYSTPSPPGVPTPPAIDLIDDSCLYVKAPMDEVDAPRIAPGSRCASASTRCRGNLPGQGQARRALRFGGREAGAHGRYRGHFDDPTAPGKLLVGYSADIEVILAVRENVVRVPTSALLEGGRVLVAGADGRLEERTGQDRPGQLGVHRSARRPGAGDRVVTSLERAGVKAGASFMPRSTATARRRARKAATPRV
jgi:HlyD family secretion protein